MITAFLNRKFFFVSFAGAFLIIFAGAGWAYAALRASGGPVVLHFSEYSGIHRIGSITELFPFAFFGLAVAVVNLFLAAEFFRRRPFYAYLLAVTTPLVALLLFVGFAAIISVN